MRKRTRNNLVLLKMQNNNACGFTLLEILIALFIFTIISLMLTSALHNIVSVQGRTENHAKDLRNLQMVLLRMSRDVEQTMDRPIISSLGQDEPAFSGTKEGFVFTHAGFANPLGVFAHSALQRSGYAWDKETSSLLQLTWPVLDQAPETKVHTRRLLSNVTAVRFEYLNDKGHFVEDWPSKEENAKALPYGVRVDLMIAHVGKISQLYLIPVRINQNTPQAPGTEKKDEHKENEDAVKPKT